MLFALGTLVIFVGSLTVWVKRQALDTDAWVDTSSQLLEDDEVRMALSVYIVDQLYASADPQAVLEERLPTNLQGLAGPIAGALRQPAVEGVDRFLQRPRVQDLWETANRVAHQELIAVLEDDTRGNITTGGGVVTLNLRTLVVNIGTELGFGDELDARLPQDVGQIEILQSDELEAAQTGVKLIKWMSWLVILIALALLRGRRLAGARTPRDAPQRRRGALPRRHPPARHPARRRQLHRRRAQLRASPCGTRSARPGSSAPACSPRLRGR